MHSHPTLKMKSLEPPVHVDEVLHVLSPVLAQEDKTE